MTAIPVLADRVMRARRETTCPVCGGPIFVGNLIARCPGSLWMHCSCLLGHRHSIDVPAAPGGGAAPKGTP